MFDVDRGIAITIEDGKYVGRCEGISGVVRHSSLEFIQGYFDGLSRAAECASPETIPRDANPPTIISKIANFALNMIGAKQNKRDK